MEHHIVHLDIPDFGASLEELRRPEFRKRPLALAEPGPRAVIQGVNDLARSEGIGEGTSLSQARRFCRRLLVVPPDPRFYKEEHHKIIQELDRFSPLVEGMRPGRYFVDLTGTKRLWGACPDTACRMEKQLAGQSGLRSRVGLASNKLTSQVAASCIEPGGMSCIFPGGEASFLDPLPVTSLPGVGPKTSSMLADFNIRQVGELAAISAEALSGVFGMMGRRLLSIARGVDTTPVVPFLKTPRFCIVRNLEKDEIDRDRLETILFQQAEEAGWNLRRLNRYPGKISIEVRYADGVIARSRHSLSKGAVDVDWRLFRAMSSAFDQLAGRRVAIRRVILELSEFSMPLRQMSLFPWEEAAFQADKTVQKTIDRIRRRFGRKAILWGKGMKDFGFPPSRE